MNLSNPVLVVEVFN